MPGPWVLAPTAIAAAAIAAIVVLVATPTQKKRVLDDDDDAPRTARRAEKANGEPVEAEMPRPRFDPTPALSLPPATWGNSASPRPLPTGPKASVRVSGPSISGGTVSNASYVVAGMAAGFRACYRRGLMVDPAQTGTVRVTAKIGPSGEVQSAATSGGGSLSALVLGCVQARVAGARFAAPDGGEATIVIPITLTPE